MFKQSFRRCLLGGSLLAGIPASLPAERFHFHDDRVLGTSFDLTIETVSSTVAAAAETAAKAEIERLEGLLSTYQIDSEISKLNRSERLTISEDLINVLRSAEQWHARTEGAFSGRLGALLARWREAAQADILPPRPELRVLAGEINTAEVVIDPATNQVTRPASVIWATDGVAKGYIIDHAFAAARRALPAGTGILLDIGGDLRFAGSPPAGNTWEIGIADPAAPPASNAAPLMTLALTEGAVATSGYSPRNYMIGGKSYSHILDSQSGWASDRNVAASVLAPDTATADALATAFMVMTTQAGLALAESLPATEALVITADGRQFASSGWFDHVKPAAGPTGLAPFTVHLDYDVPELDVARYRPPYVAIWITDARRQLVRGLSLRGDQTRWQEENYVWWRRYARKVPALVDALSQPSPLPGRYPIVWDGRDDFGQGVPRGTYTLNIEAAREHGDHTLVQIPLELGNADLDETHPAEGELGRIHVRYAAP